MANFNNYENPYQVREYVNTILVPHIYEVLCDDYGYAENDYNTDNTSDHVWEIIDNLEEIIYNYQAKKIAEAFNYDPFTSESEFTGGKFNSYNEMTFELLYNKFYEMYSEQLIY
jgi:hypothetical protein